MYLISISLYRDAQACMHLNNRYDNDGNIKLQTSSSKSLPNTPKSGEVEVKRRRTRASSAVVNAKLHMKDDFRKLDAYLERKQMEKHDGHSASKSYGNNAESYAEEIDPKYSCVHDYADTRLHLLDDNYYSIKSARRKSGTQSKNETKLLFDQEIPEASITLENDLVKDTNYHATNHDLLTGIYHKNLYSLHLKSI